MESRESQEKLNDQKPATKKRRIPLWVLGWCFVFPIPVILLLRRSRMKAIGKVGIIIASWIVWMALFAVVVIISDSVQQPSSRPEEAADYTAANIELLAQVYPSLREVENCEKEEKDIDSPKNFLILRLDGEKARIIAKNVNGDHRRSRKLTEEDVRALDLIVVAVTGSYSQNYAPYVDGEQVGGTITVHVEDADLYYFDPKTSKVFAASSVDARKLKPKESELQERYRLSNGKIIDIADDRCHLQLGFATGFGVWFIWDLGIFVFVGTAAAAGLAFLLIGSYKRGRKKAAVK